MNINIGVFQNLDWWRTELTAHPQNHIGPASITAATALLVAALWGRYQALCFACLAIASYPMTHHQIKYLMRVDLHETIYAAAVVGIQLFCRQFPYFSPIGLPMSVALAYSFTVRGMRLRHSEKELRDEIFTLKSLNNCLAQEVEKAAKTADPCKEQLEVLVQRNQEQQQLKQDAHGLEDQKAKSLNKFSTRVEPLVNTCKQFLTKGLQKTLVQDAVHEQLVTGTSKLNKTFNELIDITKQDALVTKSYTQGECASDQQLQNLLKQLLPPQKTA